LSALALAITLLAAACSPVPTTAPPAPTEATVQIDASTAAPAPPVIYFYGDSISSGRGFGTEDYPSPLNNIHEIANLLLDANCTSGVKVESDRGQDFNELYYDASNGEFKEGDFLLWTNAGPTVNDPDMYRKWLELELFATQGTVPFIATTTYDHGGFSAYNEPLASGRSLNDAVRQFAEDYGTLLLDWDKVMRQSQERVAPFGGSLLYDGIHPGVFGNFVMAAALLHYLGVEIHDLDMLPRLFSEEEGDVPDMTGELFHWGYNPTRLQRTRLLGGFLEDVKSYIEPGPQPVACN
jgi:hypothetical protein